MKVKVNLSSSVTDWQEKLIEAIAKAKKHRADLIEISYGTQAGELKGRILNFLAKDEYRKIYSRLVKSKAGWGRIFIHFRWR